MLLCLGPEPGALLLHILNLTVMPSTSSFLLQPSLRRAVSGDAAKAVGQRRRACSRSLPSPAERDAPAAAARRAVAAAREVGPLNIRHDVAAGQDDSENDAMTVRKAALTIITTRTI